MFEFSLIALCFVCVAIVLWIIKRDDVTPEEALVLELVNPQYRSDMLMYLRTLVMSIRLQDHISDKKVILEAISYYMLLQAARSEQEKREQWTATDEQPVIEKQTTHIQQKIMQGIKRMS